MIRIMSQAAVDRHPFLPGTTGWTVHDLADPEIATRWNMGAYEIVEGVLTTMAPAYFSGGNAAFNLSFFIKLHLREKGLPGRFSHEVDIVLNETRVVRADSVFLLPGDETRQALAARDRNETTPQQARLLVPPTLVIESVSPGHETHDRRTKRVWYAEFGVPNYWIVDAFSKSLECLTLTSGGYILETSASGEEEIQPRLFPGLKLNLGEIWRE